MLASLWLQGKYSLELTTQLDSQVLLQSLRESLIVSNKKSSQYALEVWFEGPNQEAEAYNTNSKRLAIKHFGIQLHIDKVWTVELQCIDRV